MSVEERGERPTPSWSAWDVCRRHWRSYAVALTVAVAVAVLVALSIPRTYSAQVKLSDESKETDLLLGLNSFASWAKTAMGSDHEGLRKPSIYAQIVQSPVFAEELSRMPLKGYGKDYYHHLLDDRRVPWWESLWSGDSVDEKSRIIHLIQENVKSKVQMRYNTTTLQVTDQDPVVAAMMVDSVRILLQRHLADYARDRAYRDLETAAEKASQARERFDKARNAYVSYADSHQDLTSPASTSEEDHLMKEYESAFNAYSADLERYRRAEAFVGKFSFSFAVIKNATVPMKPTGPSTIGYILSLAFIALVLTTWWVLFNYRRQL